MSNLPTNAEQDIKDMGKLMEHCKTTQELISFVQALPQAEAPDTQFFKRSLH